MKEMSRARILDALYNKIDDMLLDGKFEEVDNILASLEPSNMEDYLVAGYLFITSLWKGQLSNRKEFYEKVKEAFPEEWKDDWLK